MGINKSTAVCMRAYCSAAKQRYHFFALFSCGQSPSDLEVLRCWEEFSDDLRFLNCVSISKLYIDIYNHLYTFINCTRSGDES